MPETDVMEIGISILATEFKTWINPFAVLTSGHHDPVTGNASKVQVIYVAPVVIDVQLIVEKCIVIS